jgi:tetratricopeptide (TPR) repeat protein
MHLASTSLNLDSTCSNVLDQCSWQQLSSQIHCIEPIAEHDEIDKTTANILIDLFEADCASLIASIGHDYLEKYPNSALLHNLMAEAHANIGKHLAATYYFGKTISLLRDKLSLKSRDKIFARLHNNLAISLRKLGFTSKAIDQLGIALKFDPKFAEAFNNLGNIYNDRADLPNARRNYLRCLELQPSSYEAFWNLTGIADNIDQAMDLLLLSIEKREDYSPAITTLAGLKALTGDKQFFQKLCESEFKNHPIIRSFNWIFQLPNSPSVKFNRWAMFDCAISMAPTDRAFYEFGVWMGGSFRYLAPHFSQSYGFDTFDGLPENWGAISKGEYSSFSQVPKIEGAKFCVGKFEDTLPEFFSVERPISGVLNFDADLYSSTLCALDHALPVIDDKTILLFDEFLVNEQWENDEFRALEEFCQKNKLGYEVLAFSIFSKQMMCRLIF